MRSPRSVKRRHTNHHTKNTRRNRGKLIKNARMRRKQWACTLIYSSDITAKRPILDCDTVVVLKEVTNEEKARRDEKKKEKKLLAKQSIDEKRRVEQQRKTKEKDERRLKKEEEKKRKVDLENQKIQEMLKKKKMKIEKEYAEKLVSQKKAAEENARKAVSKEKENKKKPGDKEENIVKTAVPVVGNKNEVKDRKTNNAKDPNIRQSGLMSENANHDVEMFDIEKQAKKKAGKTKKTSETDSGYHNDDHEINAINEQMKKKSSKTKKTSETDSGFHNDDHDIVVSNEISEKRDKKDEHGSAHIANGSVLQTGFDKFMFDTAPQGKVPNGGSMDEDEKDKRKTHIEDPMTNHGLSAVKGNSFTTQEFDVKKPPMAIHINEVTTDAHLQSSRETSGHSMTSNTSPTQFAQNVEKLIAHVNTKMDHNIGDSDPGVKSTTTTGTHNMVLLTENKPDAPTDNKIRISPLPLDHQFSRPTTPSNRERVYKLLPKDIIYCSGLIDSHNENYAAMAADPRNVFKEDVRAIRRKIRIFKESPYYQTYLQAKKEGRSVEEVLAESGET
ncbi:hypothetical protein DICVIV_13034 [Dictyocaulus viviparus]|uniref:Nucleolar protein 16 n=1 Tax=Dictyocaulus viviparus TaxID=29172 RepID=A0A0D8X8V9_DICVI|nr:hypothetical protein DICVIV_13034 [Dictyocaulus viviparus]